MNQDNLKEEMISWQRELYKREMSIEMSKLYDSFTSWKNGETDVFNISSQIHEYYKGPSKELFMKYERPSFADLNIAEAVIKDIIKLNELSPELQILISKKVKVLKR